MEHGPIKAAHEVQPASIGITPPTLGAAPTDGMHRLEDFYSFMPAGKYIFRPTGDLWSAKSVNASVPPKVRAGKPGEKPKIISATSVLDRERRVEQMTWAPGQPLVVEGKVVRDGGWIDEPNCAVFNRYVPPQDGTGDPARAGSWVDHVKLIYPDEHHHIISWLAHRAQRPGEKINHALVLGGAQGIGKDTLLEPVKAAVGSWNFQEVSPQNLLGRFNGFLKSVILRVSEARDLGDFDRYTFYDHMKTYTAAPPDVLRVDEKNVPEYAIFNVCGVIITTNHKSDGIYLPPDDRRHFVAWSEKSREYFTSDYWNNLYRWLADGGREHVVAYLRSFDLSGFDAKAPPPKTAAFLAIVDSNRAPEQAELADALDQLNWPAATTLGEIAEAASLDFAEFLLDRRNSRKVPHRLEESDYVKFRNAGANDGLWKVKGRRVAIYVRKHLSQSEARDAVDGYLKKVVKSVK